MINWNGGHLIGKQSKVYTHKGYMYGNLKHVIQITFWEKIVDS